MATTNTKSPFEWSSTEVQQWLSTADDGAYLNVTYKFVGLPGSIFFGFTKEDLKDEKFLGPVLGAALFNTKEKLLNIANSGPPPLYDEIYVPKSIIANTISYQPPNYETTVIIPTYQTSTIATRNISSPDETVEQTHFQILSGRDKNNYIACCAFNMFGVIIEIIAIAIYNNYYTEAEYLANYYFLLFLVFGIICIIHILGCILAQRYLNEIYIVFAFIALSCAGAILMASTTILDFTFIGAALFSIATFILIRLKNRTDNYEPE